MKKQARHADQGPAVVYRGTEEAFYAPLVAVLNTEGIDARAMDTAQSGLRWDIQIISPVEIWVPGLEADSARAFIAEWEEARRAATSDSEESSESAVDSPQLASLSVGELVWRAICSFMFFMILFVHVGLVPFALFGIAFVESVLWWRRRARAKQAG